MTRRAGFWSGTNCRRAVQIAVLLLFIGLILSARFRSGVPGPVLKLFFLLDPLIAITTALAAHALAAGALLSLVVIAVTLVFGRVFCGWFCPFGTLHDLAGRLFDLFRPDRKARHHFTRGQLAKYYVLAGFLAMAVFGGHWVCVMDPLVLTYRSMTAGVLPAAQWAIEESTTPLAQSENKAVHAVSKYVTEPAYAFVRDHVFVTSHQAFLGGGLILAIFAGLLLLNAWRRRFWCRYVCPLGALLGVFSLRPLLRRATDREACNGCDLCAKSCHGAATGAAGDKWIAPECLGCLNCSESCRRSGLGFVWANPLRKDPDVAPLDISRRALFASAAGGLVALAALRINPLARGKVYHAGLIRPPGARAEREFLQRCTACGLCMKICPTGGLQPAMTEAGLEGLWTPRLEARIGCCDYNCNLCGQACPTEAIQPLTVEAKQQTKIGMAVFDVTRCIPYAHERECTVCEECCPIPDKAIYTIEVEVRDRSGAKKTVKRPHVDPDLCIGCGNCVSMCPLKDHPGIFVVSANETRHPDNQPFLSGSGYSNG
ncbi:4Fe-4S binding protein [bacterium]|nr:4Fe-4S binding protein [bacterium]